MVDVYEINIADSAWDDIYDVFSYLRRNAGESTAQNVRKGLIAEVRKLEKFPTGFPIQHNISSKQRTFRFLMKWKYKIIFFVDEDAKVIRVIAVRHSSQNPDSLKDLI